MRVNQQRCVAMGVSRVCALASATERSGVVLAGGARSRILSALPAAKVDDELTPHGNRVCLIHCRWRRGSGAGSWSHEHSDTCRCTYRACLDSEFVICTPSIRVGSRPSYRPSRSAVVAKM